MAGKDKGAAASWDQLAQVIAASGRPAEAAEWYRKAVTALKQAGDHSGAAKVLNNLAGLLLLQADADPAALAEARRLAEEAVITLESLDTGAGESWIIYTTLAQITARQGDAARAAEYRAQAREALAGFHGTRYQLKWHGALTAAVVGGDGQLRRASP